MSLVYRIAQKFVRIEALGTRGARDGDPQDPTRLNCRTTFSDDTSKVVEDAYSNRPEDTSRIVRIQTGLWAFQLNPACYQPGSKYTLHFRYEMTPGNGNVVRKDFTWLPVEETPSLPANCIVYGTLVDVTGTPVSDARLIVERYSNLATLNHREAENAIATDAFGVWSIELPRKALARFVLGNLSKVVQVPDAPRSALSDIPEFNASSSAIVDKFGYPYPVGVDTTDLI